VAGPGRAGPRHPARNRATAVQAARNDGKDQLDPALLAGLRARYDNQVARAFQVPWTNNASEQALKGPKRHQAVSGYWHTRATLAGYCRVRSYLVSARGHHIRATDAITPPSPADRGYRYPITA
jgi:hypothetical protein